MPLPYSKNVTGLSSSLAAVSLHVLVNLLSFLLVIMFNLDTDQTGVITSDGSSSICSLDSKWLRCRKNYVPDGKENPQPKF